jgi:uncharacterized membrane protein YhaH (DUF805 family)
MNPISLFTSFSGRTTRLGFWFGLIVLTAASPFTFGAVFSANPFTQAIDTIRTLGLPGLGWSLVLLIGLSAIMVKRLHDRNRSGLYAALFYAPAALTALTFFTGFTPGFERVLWWTTFIAGWMGAAGLWFLIQLGLFSGTKGANAYGPDPKARSE